MGTLQKATKAIFITKFKDKNNLVCYNNYYINIFLAINLCVIYVKRVIIMKKDMRLVRNIYNKILGFNYPDKQR